MSSDRITMTLPDTDFWEMRWAIEERAKHYVALAARCKVRELTYESPSFSSPEQLRADAVRWMGRANKLARIAATLTQRLTKPKRKAVTRGR